MKALNQECQAVTPPYIFSGLGIKVIMCFGLCAFTHGRGLFALLVFCMHQCVKPHSFPKMLTFPDAEIFPDGHSFMSQLGSLNHPKIHYL